MTEPATPLMMPSTVMCPPGGSVVFVVMFAASVPYHCVVFMNRLSTVGVTVEFMSPTVDHIRVSLIVDASGVMAAVENDDTKLDVMVSVVSAVCGEI